jgi:hypothetical protein
VNTNLGTGASQGDQNQLFTFTNVTITPTGSASATTFTSGGTYTATDSNNNTSVIYINATDTAIIGAAIPTGPTTISGVLQDYKGAGELLPTFVVPEPATFAIMGLGAAFLGLRRRHKLA